MQARPSQGLAAIRVYGFESQTLVEFNRFLDLCYVE
jgi:hypothetical protein